MQQVITIGTNGQVSGLQRKPGQGVNLQKLGHAKTTRASEIVWDENEQAWKVDVLQEAGKGVVTADVFVAALGGPSEAKAKLDELIPYPDQTEGHGVFAVVGRGPMLFDSYDDAVKVEIAYLDALRLRGIF